jgi:haloalkane dehalogenase
VKTHQRPFEVPSDLYPFEDHWFERNGSAMHYLDEGDGVPVLLMHGNPTWSFLYCDVIANLDGVRCLAPDYLGFGLSDDGPDGFGYTLAEQAEWVGAWIDHLALDRPFVMVVQDWGGPVGLLNAVKRPDEVGGLCILNTWAWVPDTFTKSFGRVLGGPLGKQLIERRNFFATTLVKRQMHESRNKPQAVFDAYAAPFSDKAARYPTWVFPREILHNDETLRRLEQDLTKLKGKPTEMVWGMEDPGFGKEKVIARWHRALGEVPTTRIEEANHFLQEDQPELIADAIKRVATQLSQPTTKGDLR